MAMAEEIGGVVERVREALQVAVGLPREEATRAIEILIRDLGAFPAPQADARICYALGACWFHLPEGGAERGREIEKWFGLALRLDPADQNARFYLGHYLFDQGRHAESRVVLSVIIAGWFGAQGQPYRDLKVRELIACCEIARDPENFDQALVKGVCRDFVMGPAAAEAVPTELVDALTGVIKRVRRVETKNFAADAVIALLGQMGLGGALTREANEQYREMKKH